MINQMFDQANYGSSRALPTFQMFFPGIARGHSGKLPCAQAECVRNKPSSRVRHNGGNFSLWCEERGIKVPSRR